MENSQQPASRILTQIVLHQIGHILGLGHSENENSVMWPVYNNFTLHQDDIRAIKKKYQLDSGTDQSVGWKQILDPQSGGPAAIEIAAAMGNHFYRRDSDGTVWEYDFAGKWEKVSGPHFAVQIDASSQYLYFLHQDGRIFRRGRDKVWEEIEGPSPHRRIIRAARNGK